MQQRIDELVHALQLSGRTVTNSVRQVWSRYAERRRRGALRAGLTSPGDHVLRDVALCRREIEQMPASPAPDAS